MADIAWTLGAMASFTPEERECAARGGTWNRATSTCEFAQPLPPSPPLVADRPGALGTVDPEQMFADGFAYINGRWVRADDPVAVAASSPLPTTALGGGGRPTAASVLGSNASVLGVAVPQAPPVALPSFVGGAVGVVRIGAGLRPESGGRERVRFGEASLPMVRWS